ncbi:MAG: hypothetical protein HY296_03835 [Thaumarchaeota archaeon]|nr:hypothetical protein [Nitrososphaerota archaeon]
MVRTGPVTFDRAVALLRRNCVDEGLKASSAYYNQVWARDSFISFLGANLLADDPLLECAKRNVLTFAKTASPLGQIANFYDLSADAPEYGYSGSTDSSSWYVIGLASLFSATRDRSLLRKPLDVAGKTYRWLRHQDANNTWLIDSPQGADWMDAAIQRTGKTLYNNTLFLIATRCIDWLLSESGGRMESPYRLDFGSLLQRFNDVFLPDDLSPDRLRGYWPRLALTLKDGRLTGFHARHYLHYVSFYRMDTRFDTFSNVLCVLSGLSEAKTSLAILASARSKGLTRPYPSRVLDPPYRSEGAGFDRTFDSVLPPQHQSGPYSYHNGGVWPFVGGAHVAALYLMGVEGADRELESLSKGNAVFRPGETTGFNEWIHGKTGEALGQYGQSWSAGMFLAAAFASKGKHLLGFLR